MNYQSFMYQLTINAPVEKGYTHERICNIFRNNFKTLKYMCMADEIGTRYHTHIFVIFSSRVRFSTVKRQFPVAHIEKCRGTISDNVDYVRKSGKWELDESKQETKVEDSFEEYGTLPPDSRGNRQDMTELYQMINQGFTNAEIIRINQDYILNIEKLDKVRTIIQEEQFGDVFKESMEVIYILGLDITSRVSGVYKLYGKGKVCRVTDYLHPFEVYHGQKIIFFDEFRDSIKLEDMLLYCDAYPTELPCRYANKYATYNKVYIASNWPLEWQYRNAQRDDKESWKAFLKRITKVIVYDEDGSTTEYYSAEEYLNRDIDNCKKE